MIDKQKVAPHKSAGSYSIPKFPQLIPDSGLMLLSVGMHGIMPTMGYLIVVNNKWVWLHIPINSKTYFLNGGRGSMQVSCY